MTSLLAGTPKKLLAGALVLLAISYAVAPSRHKPRIVPSARLSAAARRALAKFVQSKAISEGFAEALMLRWGGEFRGSVHTIIHHVLFRNRLPESPFRVQYRREILQLKDGGIVALDWAYPAPMPSGGELVRRPTVLIHHGLCGDSQSSYVRHVAPKLIARGFNVVSLVARGCGGLELKTPDGFTAARTEDMRDAFLHLETLHHVGDLYGVGFSLGCVAWLCAFWMPAVAPGRPLSARVVAKNEARAFCSSTLGRRATWRGSRARWPCRPRLTFPSSRRTLRCGRG